MRAARSGQSTDTWQYRRSCTRHPRGRSSVRGGRRAPGKGGVSLSSSAATRKSARGRSVENGASARKLDRLRPSGTSATGSLASARQDRQASVDGTSRPGKVGTRRSQTTAGAARRVLSYLRLPEY